jgi:hypothetical protein
VAVSVEVAVLMQVFWGDSALWIVVLSSYHAPRLAWILSAAESGDSMGDQTTLLITLAALLVIILVFLAGFFSVMRVWIRGVLGGVRISIFDVIGMKLRRNPLGLLIETALALKHRGFEVDVRQVETAYMAHKGQTFTPSELADLVVQRLDKSGSRELGRSE